MTATKPVALVIGAGRIGRGFIAHLLHESGWDLVFADASESLVEGLGRQGSYKIHILGGEASSATIAGFGVCHIDSPEFDRHWAAADLVFTAVGGRNLDPLADRLAKAFATVGAGHGATKNIVTCENWDQPAKQLRTRILEQLPTELSSRFGADVGVADGVVMRISVDPPKGDAIDELDVWTNDYWELPVDAAHLRGHLPEVRGLRLLPSFGSFLTRKIYTNNASNAVIAYNGYHCGYELTADAARSPEIAPLLDRAYKELNAMCVAEFGVEETEQAEFAQKAREKYSNPLIVDPLTRHARDPMRKLGPRDRLIGPARLCIKHGITPKALVRTIVAALRYDSPSDPTAPELQSLIADDGVGGALTAVCELDPDEPLYQLILEEYPQ